MTPEQFCYWLSGVLETSKDDSELDKKIRSELEKVVRNATLRGITYVNCDSLHVPGTTTPPLTVHNDT